MFTVAIAQVSDDPLVAACLQILPLAIALET
jgi:hypothetical protein